jgi:hypothetical protein
VKVAVTAKAANPIMLLVRGILGRLRRDGCERISFGY